jgi:hypothetical protein
MLTTLHHVRPLAADFFVRNLARPYIAPRNVKQSRQVGVRLDLRPRLFR